MTDTRCDLTDLLTSACSHCRGLDKPEPRDADVVGARFESRYGGRCPRCDRGFREGATVGYLDDEVCCGSCYTAAGGRRG
jgi:hypothetical protein